MRQRAHACGDTPRGAWRSGSGATSPGQSVVGHHLL